MTFLGIDGGGSKTAFLLEDEAGRELARIETGPSNWLSAGPQEAEKNLAAGIALLKTKPDVVGGGFAGAGSPEGIRFYESSLARLLPGSRIFVDTDAFVSYMGAIGLRPGVLLIAGTGSIAVGRRGDGTMIRAGGWGPIFSDEGSGFWIGREAIRRALRAHDSAGASVAAQDFVASVCQALQLESIAGISSAWKSGGLTVRMVASLASLLFSQYPAEPANEILKDAAGQLQILVETALRQVDLADCRMAIAGSIGSQPLMGKLLRQLIPLGFQPPENPPERGAIIWARSQLRNSG